MPNGIDGNLQPVINAESSDALDELFKKSVSAAEAEPTEPPELPAAPDPDPTPEPVTPVTPAAPLDIDPAPKPVTPAAPDPAAPPPPVKKDFLDEVELPPYSKPKTSESFSKVKELARSEISKRDAELATIKAENEQLKTKAVAEPLTPEIKKELEELRDFRRKLDIEKDPEFQQQFDAAITQNEESVFAKLKELGMSDERIQKMKTFGGLNNVDWDPIFEKIPSMARRFIEAKLIDIESTQDKRRVELDKAKQNASEYLKKKDDVQKKSAEQEVNALVNTVNDQFTKLDWMSPKEVPVAATAEQKAEITAHNAFISETHDRVRTVLKDRSPEMKALAAVGMAVGFRYKADAEKFQKRATIAEAELKRIKDASVLRKPGSTAGAPAGQIKPVVNYNTSASDALDQLLKQTVG